MMRASIDGIESGALRLKDRDYLLLNSDKFRPSEKPAANTRLIRNQNHRDALPICCADYGSGARNDHDILDPTKVILFFDHHAVAVEEQRRSAGSSVAMNFAPDSFCVDLSLRCDNGGTGAAYRCFSDDQIIPHRVAL
jgi:hypothetical protein